MSKGERTLPPGPNPREDLLKEKDDRQLREHLRQRHAGADPEEVAADQAEGERSGEPASKIAHTPGQAEGERELIEEEMRRAQEKERR